MNHINKSTLEKIGFYYVLHELSVASAFGKDLIYNLEPIKEKHKLIAEYKNIEKCFSVVNDSKLFNQFVDRFRRFKDIRNTFVRCRRGEILDEVELYEVKCFALLTLELKKLYEESRVQIEGITLYDFSEVYKLLNPLQFQTSSFYIYDEYSEKLKEIRCRKKSLDKNVFKERDEEKQKQLFEIRQGIIAEEKAEEFEIKKFLSSQILIYTDKLLQEAFLIGKLDFIVAKAKLAIDYNMCCPSISEELEIKMDKGINPMVKAQVEKSSGRFYPVSIEVSKGSSVITGANMGGKTVLLSIIALNYVLATLGFYSFAEKFEFSPLSFIYFLSEDSESLKNGLSTFGGEVLKLKKILEKVKEEKGLVILDEFARGTNPFEGSNITRALVSYMNSLDSICIISTHYDGVCSKAKLHYQVRGLRNVDFEALKGVSLNEKDCLKLINDCMDYSVEKVDIDKSVPRDAINICTLMGIDEEIINTAKRFYKESLE